MSRFWQNFRAGPMLMLAFAAAAGIAGRDFWGGWWSVALAVMAGLIFVPDLRRGRFPLSAALVALLFSMLHGWRLSGSFEHPLLAELRSMPEGESRAVLRGSLLPLHDGAEAGQGLAVCHFHSMKPAGDDWRKTRGWVRVQLPPKFDLAVAGEYEIEGVLQAPAPPLNPGQFDFAAFCLRKGWVAQMRASRVVLVERRRFAPRFAFIKAAESCRAWIIARLSHGIPEGSPDAAVILAMTLGISDAAGEEVEDAFRGSGTLHVFAISGLHVMMLAGIFLWAARALGYQRGVVLVIALLFGYAFITGWRPSAARASVMASMLLMAPLFNRRNRLGNTLGASALLLLLADTQNLFMPGFQLTFGVLLGIALLAVPMMEKLKPWYEMDPFLPPQVASRWQRWSVKARTWLAGLLTVSLSAWTGSLPFMLGHFDTITPVGLLANLLLVPMAGMCLSCACASLMLSLVQLSWLSALANQANALLASLMVWTAGLFAGLPGASFSVDLRWEKSAAPVELRVFHLPNGGQAAHLRGGDRHWLLDTGNERAWRSVLQPWFRSQGINRLDGLFLSHADIAHVGAAPLALDSMRPPKFHTSLLEPWPFDPPESSLRRLERLTPPGGPRWHRLALEAALTLGADHPVHVLVLHPAHGDRHEKADDRGLILMLARDGVRVLWMNDAGFATARRLLQRGTDLRCDILIQSQHKTDKDGLADLLPAASPQVVILGSPEPITTPDARLHLKNLCMQSGIQLLETGVAGSVGMEFEQGAVLLKCFHDGREIRLVPANRNTSASSGLPAED
ncbi:MAG TPA: hypothetical protein DIT13_19605 [Verrucomicrobiales bacterium]|nr:hypothetical protein [Verrucomicrobiales bacterium]HRJ09690.1 ComEC/Rec2 family competence protein [Prosthecobacter sp.]HRK14845.1 ComEC/Rec2 family competence protein [Prosthecobacter sp.]